MLIPNKHSGHSPDGRRLYPGGGKGTDIPAPDPRLIEAQIKSMGYQDDAIRQIMANSSELMPLQKQQLQFGLDAAKTAYDQSQQDRGWVLDRRGALGGLQDQLVKDASSYNSEARQRELAAQAAADVSQSFGLSRSTLARQMGSYGLDPNKGNFGLTAKTMATDEALARAGAINKTRQAARLEGFALTDRATNALAGYPAMGMQATGAGAGFGGMGLSLANTGLAGLNSGYGAAITGAGSLGSNATGMYGAQGNFNTTAAQIAAASDPFNTLLGAAGGVGSAWALNKFVGK